MSESAAMVPPEVVAAVAAGRWPADSASAILQNLSALVPADVMRRETDGDEGAIYLQCPPFQTVSEEARDNSEFWTEFGALHQIRPESLLVLGDFGPGSDAVFVVELVEPRRVLRLRWSDSGTEWVPWAQSLSELLERLGLR